MCSIAGAFSTNAQNEIKSISNKLKHRGPDASRTSNLGNLYLGHNLLSLVGYLEQPIQNKTSVLVANCEIYNWKELAKKYNLNPRNDADLLFLLLNKNKDPKKILKILKELDGMYAFAFFWDDNGIKGVLSKDFFGEKPLWYYIDKQKFYFASEKKALPDDIRNSSFDLGPRELLFVDLESMSSKSHYKGFYKYKISKDDYKKALKKTEKLIDDSIKYRVDSNAKIGILCSGGVDSSLIAKIASTHNKNVICYNCSLEDGEDKKYAKILADKSNLNIKFITPKKEEVILAIPEIIRIIESSDPIKVSVALPYYFAAKEAQKDGVKIMLSGNAADDLFCGYERYNTNFSPTKDTISKLRKIYDTDIYRDDLIFMNFGIELRLPYLSKKLVDYVITLPDNYKITDDVKKKILRDIAAKYLPEEIYTRPKKAAQYGSKLDKVFGKIADENANSRGEYTSKYLKENESRIAILWSGGKDSALSMHILNRMNYKVECLVTIKSKNLDSYMFHTPWIDMTRMQAEALNLPLILKETKGVKEKELDDLYIALKEAKMKYRINGIGCGAIFSTYQRDRVEKIADKLGLKVYAPLWHMDQYMEVKQVIDFGIEAIIVKVAAAGLDNSYIGKKIDLALLEEFKKLNEKFGFNIAGEGGEYESFVYNAPLFKNKITLTNS